MYSRPRIVSRPSAAYDICTTIEKDTFNSAPARHACCPMCISCGRVGVQHVHRVRPWLHVGLWSPDSGPQLDIQISDI